MAVANWTRCPARHALTPSAVARCVLPVPGRAEQDHVLAAVQEVELAEVLDHLLLDRALEGEVELLKRLSAGKRAALILFSPPWLSRAETSLESSACRNFS